MMEKNRRPFFGEKKAAQGKRAPKPRKAAAVKPLPSSTLLMSQPPSPTARETMQPQSLPSALSLPPLPGKTLFPAMPGETAAALRQSPEPAPTDFDARLQTEPLAMAEKEEPASFSAEQTENGDASADDRGEERFRPEETLSAKEDAPTTAFDPGPAVEIQRQPSLRDAMPDFIPMAAMQQQERTTQVSLLTPAPVKSRPVSATRQQPQPSQQPEAPAALWGLLRKFASEHLERAKQTAEDYIPDYSNMTEAEMEALAYGSDPLDDMEEETAQLRQAGRR
jgi:hypothetical protein